jgi:hypothetical protein
MDGFSAEKLQHRGFGGPLVRHSVNNSLERPWNFTLGRTGSICEIPLAGLFTMCIRCTVCLSDTY